MTQQSETKNQPTNQNPLIEKGRGHLIIMPFALEICSYTTVNQHELTLFQPGTVWRTTGIWFKILIQDAKSV